MRDNVVDFVRKWSEKTGMPAERLVKRLGIAKSKFYDWQRRYGKVNEHNAWIPRDSWLLPEEKEAIIEYLKNHPSEGCRRLTYMMMDEDIVAVSPSSVYRVLSRAGLLSRWNVKPSKKGTGFSQPTRPHEHWHTDISYLNICGTFYYLCSVLDGFSRYIVHWEIRERMKESDVEIVLQRAREIFPNEKPRIISDNGPQFIARDFKEFIRISGMTHVRTSPYYPQSNGKLERYHKTIKHECIRRNAPLSVEDARRIVAEFVEHYNNVRLHGAIGYVAPRDKMEGRAEAIQEARERKLEAAREARKIRRSEIALTTKMKSNTLSAAGETEAGNAGERPARDSRPGGDEYRQGGAERSPNRFSFFPERFCAQTSPGKGYSEPSHMPQKNSGVWGGAPASIENETDAPDGRESPILKRRLSNSR